MALERLQARAAARIPDLDGVLRRRRYQLRGVGRGDEGGGAARVVVRLLAGAAASIKEQDGLLVRRPLALVREAVRARAAAGMPVFVGVVPRRRCRLRRVVREGD